VDKPHMRASRASPSPDSPLVVPAAATAGRIAPAVLLPPTEEPLHQHGNEYAFDDDAAD
jgi:hypothetical protein